jgi:AcrR family transcriptional regulator
MRPASQFRPGYHNGVASLAQASRSEPALAQGLRGRKKERTRAAIRDAALELFAERGYEATTVDQIAERAEVSKATFFRYFATKGEVIFTIEGYRLEPLADAIVGRPAEENDLVAAGGAVRDEWVPTLDPRRIERQTRAAATSPLLRGMSLDLAQRWQEIVATALGRRHGLAAPDPRCRLVASLVFVALSNAVNLWVQSGCRGELGPLLDDAFALLTDVCREVGNGDARPPSGTR